MPRNEAKITLTAEDRASAALRQVRAEASKLQPAIGQIRDVASSIGLLAGGGITLSLAGAASAIRTMVGALDDLDEASQAAGVSAVALAELRQGAAQAGVGASELDTAVTRLNVKLADAAAGNEQAAALFRALGVAVTDTNGKVRDTDAVLADVAEQFAGYADGANKSALAVDLFGRAGARLIPYLNQGADGLRVYSGLTEETVKQSAALQSEFDKLSAATKRWGYELAGVVVPALNKLIDIVPRIDFGEALRGFGTGGIGGIFKNLEGQVAAIRSASQALESQRRVEDRGFTPGREAPVVQRASAGGSNAAAVKERRTAEKDINVIMRERYELALREANGIQAGIDADRARAAGLQKQIEDLAGITRAREQLSAQNELDKAFFDGYVQVLEDGTQVLRQLTQAEYDLASARNQGIVQAAQDIEKASDAADQFALTMTSAVSQLITGGGSAGDVFKALLQDITQLVVKLTVLEPLAAQIKDIFGGGGAGRGGSGFLSLFSSLFGGGLASGGPVQAGRTYLVGERGPELLVSGSAGRVIPNHAIGGANVSISVINNAGAQVSATSRQDGGGTSIDVIIDSVESALAGNVTRGRGSLYSSMQGAFGLRSAAR
jgi:hypothetical protein